MDSRQGIGIQPNGKSSQFQEQLTVPPTGGAVGRGPIGSTNVQAVYVAIKQFLLIHKRWLLNHWRLEIFLSGSIYTTEISKSVKTCPSLYKELVYT